MRVFTFPLIAFASQILKSETTIIAVHNDQVDEALPKPIQQPKLHVELDAPTIGAHTFAI